MTEKDWPKVVGTLLVSVLLFILMTYMGVTNGFLKILIVGLLVLSFFADKFGETGRTIRKILLAVAAVLFLLSWWFTKPTAKWAQHRTEEVMPRDNFDPRAEKPEALVRFYELPDGTVKRAGDDWKNHPITGERLAAPGTDEFLRLLTKYEVQKTQEKSPVTGMNRTCTYCFGSGCEVSMPAVIGPGRFEVRNREHGTTATYTWSLSGEGRWSNPFPSEHGPGGHGGLRWKSQDYQNGEFKGEEWNDKTPDHKTTLVLLCQGSVPHPNS